MRRQNALWRARPADQRASRFLLGTLVFFGRGEVPRLICRGNTKKQVANQLVISPSTVDHHVRHIYQKAGVRTRAGATLLALQHDLLK